MGGVCNKQGSTDSGKWRSLAGLLPGGGLKWTPPGHQSSLFHPPGVGRSDRRRWAPESPDVREEATYGCSMVLACGQVFTLEASEARAPHSRHTSNSTTTEHATVQCTEAALPHSVKGAMNSSTSHRPAPLTGRRRRDELEHLSQAGLASTLGMRRLSSPRPRSLMLHRFAPRPSTKSSADTLRIRENRRLGAAWCTSCSRAAECCAHAVSGDAPNMCVELRCESRNAGEPQRSPTRSR